MKTTKRAAILGVVAASAVGIACGGPPGEATDLEAAAKAPLWTFTKIPNVYQARAVAIPASGLDALVFEMRSSGGKDVRVTRMAFMVGGSLQSGNLSNYRLVHFPGGPSRPGTVIGTNAGATWAPGPTSSIVAIDLAAPLAVGQNFRGEFALKVDVDGTPPFFFSPQLQTVTIRVAGVEQFLVGWTCDLPLPGDTFYVN